MRQVAWWRGGAALGGAAVVALAGASAALAQAAGAPAGQTAADQPAGTAQATVGGDDIIVTATRHAEPLSRVPVSVSAFTGEQMETLGIKSFAEIQRFTPGVQFNTERKDVAIRGISSQAGTGTTGLYIDDTPIQVRALGLNANNTEPVVFDLERVEVLRGPQGTLFGAGSEGGTVRYITPEPSVTTYSGYSRAEVSAAAFGEPSFEVGTALGGPIVRDQLGFRASAYFRRDGGYIDRIDYQTGRPTQSNANYVDTLALRGALAWHPSDAVTVTPAIFYQHRYQNQNDRYWVADSTPGHLVNGTPDRQEDRDRYLLPSLKIQADLGGVTVISNTSYFDRKEIVNGYSGTLYNLSLFQQLLTNVNADGSTGQNFNLDPYTNPTQAASAAGYPLLTATGINLPQFPGYVARTFITNQQQNITQELRAQSSDANARFSWVAGVFFQTNKQVSTEEINDPELPTLVPLLFGGDFPSFTEGVPLLANGDSYINSTHARDRQIAGFANATYGVTDRLKATAGVRYAWTKFTFTNFADGPQNVGPTGGGGGQSEHPFTYKAGLDFQATRDDLYYLSTSKGFRIGGANIPFPVALCQADIDRLGGVVPTTYNSDDVYSYEVGAKNKFANRRVSVQASAFYLVWTNIQQANYLTSCGFQYIGNLGTVHSKGFDAQVSVNVTPALRVDTAVGYTEARYSKTTLSAGPGSLPLSSNGDTIPGYSPWTVVVGAQYDFTWGGRAGFVRGDYSYQSRNPWTTTGQDPNNAVIDLAAINDPAYSQVNLRAGLTLAGIQVEAFINNLTDAHPQLNLSHEDQYTALFEAETLRPRTYGLAASYRF